MSKQHLQLRSLLALQILSSLIGSVLVIGGGGILYLSNRTAVLQTLALSEFGEYLLIVGAVVFVLSLTSVILILRFKKSLPDTL